VQVLKLLLLILNRNVALLQGLQFLLHLLFAIFEAVDELLELLTVHRLLVDGEGSELAMQLLQLLVDEEHLRVNRLSLLQDLGHFLSELGLLRFGQLIIKSSVLA
jgi:hypothetical protein